MTYKRFLLSNVLREGEGGPVGAPPAPAPPADPPAPAAFDWTKLEGMDATRQAIVTNKSWKDPVALLDSYANLEKLAKGDPNTLLRLPGKDAPAEAWNDVYGRLGKPAKAEDYKVPVPDGADPTFAKTAAGWFHKANLTQAQVEALAPEWNAFVAAQTTQQTEARARQDQQEIELLKSNWGGEFEMRTARVDKAAEAFGMNGDQLAALKTAMGPKAAMEFLDNIGAKLGVEGNFQGGGNGGGGQLTQEQARAELNRLRADANFGARFNSNDPETKARAREEIQRLEKRAAGL